MYKDGHEQHSETDEARAGSTPHVVRWILGISLAAAIILLSAIWIIGAATQGDIEEEANVSQVIRDTQAADNDRSDIDGVVSQEADEFAPETPADVIQGTEDGPNRTIEN
jgi:hypothetical protein